MIDKVQAESYPPAAPGAFLGEVVRSGSQEVVTFGTTNHGDMVEGWAHIPVYYQWRLDGNDLKWVPLL